MPAPTTNHRGRRLGRLRAGEPAERRSAVKRAAARGGRQGRQIWIHVPLGLPYCSAIRAPTGATDRAGAGLNGRALRCRAARCSAARPRSTAWSMCAASRSDYDLWRQLGNAGWAWDDVLPYFKQAEDYARGADEMHGGGGALRVEDPRVRWEILDAFIEAASKAASRRTRTTTPATGGLRLFPGRPTARPALVGGDGLSAAGAQPPEPASRDRRAGDRMRLEGGRAIGVEYWQGERCPAPRGARSSSLRGAIGSPQVLQLSGIGPAALLRELGIAVRARAARRRREPAGPCADARMMFQRQQTGDAQREATARCARSGWGSSTLFSERPADDGAGAARRLHPQRSVEARRPTSSARVAVRARQAGEPLHASPASRSTV